MNRIGGKRREGKHLVTGAKTLFWSPHTHTQTTRSRIVRHTADPVKQQVKRYYVKAVLIAESAERGGVLLEHLR